MQFFFSNVWTSEFPLGFAYMFLPMFLCYFVKLMVEVARPVRLQCTNKGSWQDHQRANKDVNNLKCVFRCLIRKGMHSVYACLHVEDTHNAFWLETVDITFASLHEKLHRAPLNQSKYLAYSSKVHLKLISICSRLCWRLHMIFLIIITDT